MEALKGHEVLWYNYTYVLTRDMMLKFDELTLYHMRLKIPAPKVTKEVVIQEGIRRKMT